MIVNVVGFKRKENHETVGIEGCIDQVDRTPHQWALLTR